jgi:outer membrane protein TolC
VEQATRAYEIAELRYREGLSTQTELQDVRLQLEQARANQAQAARDLQVARLRLTLLPYLPLGTADATALTTSTVTSTGAAAQAFTGTVTSTGR